MLYSGVHLCAEKAEKPYFKRLSGIEKVHRNSIKITVDLWRRRRDLVFDHVCGARNCSARCRFAQFRPLHPRFGRFSRHRRRSLPRLSCRSPALGQIFLCQIKMHPYGVHFYLAEKERFELSRRLSRPTPLAGAPLRPLEYFSKGCQRSSQN